ncbi:hypothetical protein [Halosimplex marinum]|uniref:hypothetical protein n=1 Tax=Halosimplex marinum TaxID=3396620 RepID=UPI003F5770F8
MHSLPLLNEKQLDLLVCYSLSSGEEMSVAIVNAFHAANIDVFEKSTRLDDWVNTDVFESIHWTSDHPLYLSTRIWGYRVVITPEEVRIYTTMDLNQRL